MAGFRRKRPLGKVDVDGQLIHGALRMTIQNLARGIGDQIIAPLADASLSCAFFQVFQADEVGDGTALGEYRRANQQRRQAAGTVGESRHGR